MKRALLSALTLLAGLCASARVQLTPLFSDDMVFQQRCSAPVWGKAAPGAVVEVTPSWNRRTYSTVTGADGKWSVNIDTPKGSFKKHSISISDGEPVVLHNVLVGEVWLASGQSNMQMPMESWRAVRTNQDDINNASQYSGLRLLQVSRATGMSEHDYFSADFGKWTESSPETVRNFSAVAWYFGRKLMQDLKVPVGIILSSWGGTVIEAWMSAGAVNEFPEFRSDLAQVRSLSDNESERERTFEEEISAFYNKVTAEDKGLVNGVAVWAKPGFDDSAWRTMTLPAAVQELWPDTNGIYWFRKEIEIPAGWAGQDLTLSLGPIDDFDETYWNGEQVGSGRVWNKGREYTVPARLVKPGKTVICIRNTDDHGNGGLYGDASLMYVVNANGEKIRLDNEWKVTLSVSFEGMPKSTAREPNLVTVLYNAMVKPLAPFAIKGAIWYQGESNADRAFQYRELMSSMILDWRALWRYDFPFYITQLANYKDIRVNPGDDEWAELREAQALATQKLDKVGMACIMDLGEADDIHPVRKQEVGSRLASLAEANDYGRKQVCKGPQFESYRIQDGSIRVKFSNVAGGLRIIPSGDFAKERYGAKGAGSEMVEKAERGELCGFQIAGADMQWRWAEARIEGDEVVVSNPEVKRPVAVRYAWSANPVCNLFNSEGLPAEPFRTDGWPEITAGR